MVTDPISDMLTRVKNGYMAKLSTVSLPWSKQKAIIAEVLAKNGFLGSVESKEEEGRKVLVLNLKYDHKEPALSGIKRVSRPSLRIYSTKTTLPKVLGGIGMAIISTSKGVMTDKEARKASIGGEVICEVW